MAKLPDIMKEDRPFNMAVMWLARLDTRLDEINTASIQGDLLTWYRGLRVIYRMVHFKIKEAGEEELEKVMEEQFKKCKIMVQESFGDYSNSNKEAMQMSLSDLEIELDKLEQHLNDLMAQYKLVLPEIQKNKYEENQLKFLDMYVKSSFFKQAVKDPDKYMRKHAPEMWQKFLELAIDHVKKGVTVG
jgi:hypothetical protein